MAMPGNMPPPFGMHPPHMSMGGPPPSGFRPPVMPVGSMPTLRPGMMAA
jgi:hypothetical protein